MRVKQEDERKEKLRKVLQSYAEEEKITGVLKAKKAAREEAVAKLMDAGVA
jgi:hypothetical protein